MMLLPLALSVRRASSAVDVAQRRCRQVIGRGAHGGVLDHRIVDARLAAVAVQGIGEVVVPAAERDAAAAGRRPVVGIAQGNPDVLGAL